jgi:hypothetical protein
MQAILWQSNFRFAYKFHLVYHTTGGSVQAHSPPENTGFPGFDGISSRGILQLSEQSRIMAAERTRAATASGFIAKLDGVKSGPYCRFEFCADTK